MKISDLPEGAYFTWDDQLWRRISHDSPEAVHSRKVRNVGGNLETFQKLYVWAIAVPPLKNGKNSRKVASHFNKDFSEVVPLPLVSALDRLETE